MNELKKIPLWAWAAIAVAVLYFMSKRRAAAPQFATAGIPAAPLNSPAPSAIAPSAPTSNPSGITNVTGLLGQMQPLPQNWAPLSRQQQTPPLDLSGLRWLQ